MNPFADADALLLGDRGQYRQHGVFENAARIQILLRFSRERFLSGDGGAFGGVANN
jgi:hypothetical protein